MDTDEEEGQDSVKTPPDLNRQEKRKTPEVEEVNKPQPRKKVKASKENNIDDTPGLTSEELDEALLKSTEVLTKKWSEFAAVHLDAINGVAQHISELKDLAAQSVTGTITNSTSGSVHPKLRQWPARENKGQVSTAALLITDAASRVEMSMTVGIDYTKMSMIELHLYQSAIAKEIQARDHYSQIQLDDIRKKNDSLAAQLETAEQ